MRTYGALAALLLVAGCGHQVCATDADCPSDAVCHLKACTKKSTTNPRPSDCGDRCEVDRVRCEYEMFSVRSQRCTVGGDGCAVWSDVRECSDAERCDDGQGCTPTIAEGGACTDDRECAGTLRCAAAGDGAGRCQRSCANGESCEAGEICAFQLCQPASLCDGCEDLGERCVGDVAERCGRVDGECFRWRPIATCERPNVCERGECIGTVEAGGGCSEAAYCRAGLVCASGRCTPECATSAACASGGCRVTRESGGKAICAEGAGPTVEASCRFGLGAVSVPGAWDIGLTSSLPPDLFVRIDVPGADPFTSGIIGDSNTGDFSTFTPSYPFAMALGADLQLYDSDGGLSGADLVARWAVFDAVPWDQGSRTWSVALTSGDARLEVEVDCSR